MRIKEILDVIVAEILFLFLGGYVIFSMHEKKIMFVHSTMVIISSIFILILGIFLAFITFEHSKRRD